MKKSLAVGLTSLVISLALPVQIIRAQGAAVVVPVGAAVAIVGGIACYVFLNSLGQRVVVPINNEGYLEDPEDEDQWGEYPSVRSLDDCRYKAAGRIWDWDGSTKTCYIKG